MQREVAVAGVLIKPKEVGRVSAIYRQVYTAIWVEVALVLTGAAVIAGLSILRG